MAVVTSIMRAQQVLLARADAVLRRFGLTFARYETLILLSFSKKGSLPLGKIGERLQINAPSVTSSINRLERDGLVVRCSNPADGRGTLAQITRSGRLRAGRATTLLNEQLFGDLGMNDDELEALFGALRALRRAAGDFD
jgi:DNA-binding MarR family transcriptional regulator